ncbi:MAG: hypothetical protein GC151_02375 [Betaproteobacteria bacterium]|nr:hypothetical protein [Betaproteobacteria bacterium]
MPEGTVLPTITAGAANVAAQATHDASDSRPLAGADDAGGQSFKSALKAEMDKPGPTRGAGTARGARKPSDDSRQDAAASDGPGPARPDSILGLGLGSDASIVAAVRAAQVSSTDAGRSVARDVAGGLRDALEKSGRATAVRGKAADAIVDDSGGTSRRDVRVEEAGKQFAAVLGKVDGEHGSGGGDREARTSLPAALAGSASVAGQHLQDPRTPDAGSPQIQPVGHVAQRSDVPETRPGVTVPLSSPDWHDAFADRVSVVVQTRQPSAELQINPPNLGPVEVRVSMTGDQAVVQFFSPHAPVREAIQAAIPRLGEALAASGLSLGGASVGAESRSGSGADSGRSGRTQAFPSEARVGAVSSSGGELRWRGPISGLRAVDLFA